MTEFNRQPREGGYTFVTARGFPGFRLMLKPSEGDSYLLAAFKAFVEADVASAVLQALIRDNPEKVEEAKLRPALI
jgi:hypothetical protein